MGGGGDVVAGRMALLASDAAPPEPRRELLQVSPRGIGCDLGGHSSLRTVSCAYCSGANACRAHLAACIPIWTSRAGSLSRSSRVLVSASADSSAGATPVTPST